MVCANLFAQQYPFVYYTPRDGLVNSRVRSIKQDSRGRMLFATYGGLSIYDGVKFKNYSQEDGLANDLVNDIIEITPDSFLIATNTSSLNTLVRGKIGLYQTSDNFYPVTNRFFKSNDGFLYVIADDGLFKLVENKFIQLPLEDESGTFFGGNLDRITEWNNYFFLIPWNSAQKEKLIIYNKESQKVSGSITEKNIANTAISPKGELWVSSSTGIEILDLPELQNGNIVLNPLSREMEGDWKDALIYFDHFDDGWIYQFNSAIRITNSGPIQMFSPSQGLKTSNLSDIFVDREGNTWMASDGNGIVKMPGTNVQILGDLRPGIKNNISAMCQDADTTWVFNETDHSFYRIHNNQLSAFPLKTPPHYIGNIFIQKGSLYFIAEETLIKIKHKDLLSSYSQPTRIFFDSLPILGYGEGIVDPYGNYIQTIQTGDNTFYLVVIENDRIKMKQPLSYPNDHLALDKYNTLWVPTRDNHLMAYSLNPGKPIQYLQLKYDYSDKIKGLGPRSITTDTFGNIWIGTRYSGIHQLGMKDEHFQSLSQITTQHGLIDNFHYQLHCDPHNNIWAGSQTGLDKISFKNGNYIIDNVTKSKNIFQRIYTIIDAADKVIWALTTNGDIIRVSENGAGKRPPFPSLFITSFSVNDQEYDENARVFEHDQNNFSISVAAPSFLDEKSVTYSYRLQGSGKNAWSEPSNVADFNFINLDHGSYRLLVKAEFPAEVYPDQELVIAFTIKPPWWKTWWFLSLAIITTVTFLVLIIQLYYSRKLEKQRILLEKKQAIEKERTRIATDMHDDLGAGLSRIKFLSETIGIKKQQHEPIEEEITNIRHYAHEMIDKMGEIVWALNEKNDSLNDLLSYTRAYAMEYLAENGITSKIDKLPVLQPLMVNGEFRRNIYLSVKEVLHNVVKHARAGTVTIKFEVNEQLNITIRDNGIGFNQEKNVSFGNGISNIKKRMAEIRGEMKILQDNGTVIMLTAPLGH